MAVLFSLIIPTFDSHKDLERLLSSLASMNEELDQVEIIVVDDGSYDDTEEVALGFRPRFENMLYLCQKNRGPAAARNLGAANARGRYLIFVDDDCVFRKGCLKSIKRFHADNADYAGVGIKTVNNTGSIFSEFNQRLGDYLMHDSRTPEGTYGYVSSRCHSILKEGFLRVNGYDEDFIWPAAEDRDLCFRMARDGMKLAYAETEPLLNTDRLGFAGFARQNFFYGLGAGLLTQKHPGILSKKAFWYRELILKTCGDRNALKGMMLFMSLILAQICSIAGIISYKINYDRMTRPPSSFIPKHAIIVETAKNIILGLPYAKTLKKGVGSLTTGEELYSAGNLASSAKKAFNTYREAVYKVTEEGNWLEGKRVLEVGPGSHLAVPLLFVAEGAEKVVSIDRYGEVKSRRKETLVYEKLMHGLSDQNKDRIAPALKGLCAGKMPGTGSFKIAYLPDTPIEAEEIAKVLPEESFDLIVSFNTLEHIKDLNAAFRNMRKLLKKGGILVHRVDAGSHYAVTRHTKNRLSHFMLSDLTFNMMFSNRDGPTRRVLDDYLRIARGEKFDIREICVDETACANEIEKSRKFLDSRYRDAPLEDLPKVGFVIAARRE